MLYWFKIVFANNYSELLAWSIVIWLYLQYRVWRYSSWLNMKS